ncbi:double-stranded RNA-binding protein 8-like [Musa acuminata AAA Group]|uniref:double-stranded RNA-binding protein 8-like n=1 Tax=Musa acuminata AAA Group TaxID=214697 RepID=UPI0031E28825
MNLEVVILKEDTEKNKEKTSKKNPDDTKGVASCYVFKSRLQEYAQKVGIPTPVYQTLKEGPSHEPVFKSTVIVNNTRYDSLPGFFNRKAAEQSAAEIALMEIHKSGLMTENMPTVHETGLCKNLLQEYAQKMNYAIPSDICTKNSSGATPFTCTVEIGGIQYIGAAARTKKEAEIKVARTALLAIQSQSQGGIGGALQYTVLPGKRKVKEPELPAEAVKKIKPKKANFKKWSKKQFQRSKDNQVVQSTKNETEVYMLEDASRVPSSAIQIEEAAHDS